MRLKVEYTSSIHRIITREKKCTWPQGCFLTTPINKTRNWHSNLLHTKKSVANIPSLQRFSLEKSKVPQIKLKCCRIFWIMQVHNGATYTCHIHNIVANAYTRTHFSMLSTVASPGCTHDTSGIAGIFWTWNLRF